MFNEAQLSVVGYVASEPQFSRVGNGIPKLTMKVAWTTRHRDPSTGEWVDGNTSFVRVTCWRRLADNLATCLRKGDPVLLRGRLDVRPFTGKDGVRRVSVDVDASHLGHDLTRGVAGFRRVWETTGRTAEQAAAENGGAGGMPADGEAVPPAVPGPSAPSGPPAPAALPGGPVPVPANGALRAPAGDLDDGAPGGPDDGAPGDLDDGAPGGLAGDGDPAGEEIFDDGAIEALAEDTASVAAVS